VHATGVGLVLLAHAPHDVRESVLNTELRRYTKYTITDPRRLRRVLADVRLRGHAISDRQIELISTSVAAPIRGADGSVVAALSVVAAARQIDPRHFVPAVVAAGRGVSRTLSAFGAPGSR
jgi:DNA-binding IclR family transcriptional regulator